MTDLQGYRQLNERTGDGLTVCWFWRSIGGHDEHVITVEDVRLDDNFQTDPLHSFEDARHRYIHPMASVIGIRTDGSEAREPMPVTVSNAALGSFELSQTDRDDLADIPETPARNKENRVDDSNPFTGKSDPDPDETQTPDWL